MQNWDLLRINKAENRNNPTTFGKSVAYQILTTTLQQFRVYMEESIYGHVWTLFYFESI
jgi:hypothetical protein